MAKTEQKKAVSRFSAGANLDALECEILDAMAAEALAGSAAAAKLILLAIDRRRAALNKRSTEPTALDAAGRPSIKLCREAL